MNRKEVIAANAEKLRVIQKAIHETFRKRDRSREEYDEWSAACDVFHEQYDDLFYPGGGEQLGALRRCDPAAIEIALDFLEVDPWYFRSGYHKEYIWTYLPQCSLSSDQFTRLEAVAHVYLRRRISREFWYMCRVMSRFASTTFWEQIRIIAKEKEDQPEGIRASYLVSYSGGIAAGEKVRRDVYAEVLHQKYGHLWEDSTEGQESHG